ncbi:MAG: phosphoglycerate dehydrogenase [Propionibacteriaceae bacterium]|nr:phosphoglycerate dehydrogenase [Propionibacteriaceae bacterium]
MKALLLENIHSEAVRALEGRGYQVELRSGALGEAELADALEGVELLGIRSRTHITGTVLKAHPQLLAVGAFCIGTNQIDLPAAAAAGVAVFNAPYSNTRSVVELALGEIITMARRLGDKNASMHAGIWDKSANGSHEVRGRTLGIVGYGNIGSQLSVLAEAMGMKVYFYDVVDRLALGNATRVDSMQELFETCETISLHVDGRASNARLIGEREFAQMRPRTLFLNLCRGNVVDVDALAAALQSGHIAGAAVDVFPDEPKSKDELFVSPLQGISNVILTPHVGGSTLEAQVDIGRYVAGKLADYEAYGNTSMAVNLPEVSVPVPQAERILHLHRNVPGVLARLNHTLAGHNMNIGSQTLSTLGEYGYVVTDVSGQHYEGLLAELQALEESIRVRMI